MNKKNFNGHLGDLIWRLTRRKNRFAFALSELARLYHNAYHDRSNHSQWNGEHLLLRRLGELGAKTIFDVGANVGDWTHAATETAPQAIIHSFELAPSTAAMLAERFRNNDRVLVNAFGLSDHDGTVEFREFEDNTLNSLIVDNSIHLSTSTVGQASVRRGDDYCSERGITKIDLLKVDAEGADSIVLAGFERMLSQGDVRLVQFEYGYAALDTRFFLVDYVRLFDRFGYTVAPLRSKGIDTSPYEHTWNGFDFGPNFVAFRKADTELIHAIAPR